ncbi:SRPBCC family protein [Afipia birgiae]|uniref:SRPBCC family protein n=1 Tax=Afipia birgiae TaxID=151414 RepID=UPI00030EEA99|nr:SRPBCC family protein [Afipia birgiae]MBX9821844.1 SRPBCC family protein [Afipia birgiae]
MNAPATVAFERSHDIVINAPAKAVFDYVTNPQSWPEWLAASHHIDSENRPLEAGELFHEKWHIRSGEVSLNWIVRACVSPKLWIVQAETDFIGPIVVQYTCEDVGGGTKFTRTLRNPARKKPPTDEQIANMDAEAAVGLGNIKANVEKRADFKPSA